MFKTAPLRYDIIFTDDIEKSKKSGMNSHIAKPINVEHLLDITNRYLNPAADEPANYPQTKCMIFYTPSKQITAHNYTLLHII
jgi:hypothetical protein